MIFIRTTDDFIYFRNGRNIEGVSGKNDPVSKL